MGPVASPQPEFAINPYAPRSVPAKFVPYGGNDVQHPPPVSIDELIFKIFFINDETCISHVAI